jgi:hypothetical protein
MRKRTLIVTTIIALALVLASVPAVSVEREIQIGYSPTPAGVDFYFNVPVTRELIDVIRKQEGVASAFTPNRYEVIVVIGRMFSHDEPILNIMRTLEKEIFAGKVVEAQQIK